MTEAIRRLIELGLEAAGGVVKHDPPSRKTVGFFITAAVIVLLAHIATTEAWAYYEGWHALGGNSRIRFRVINNKTAELAGISSPCGFSESRPGPIESAAAKIIKVDFAEDAITIIGFVFERPTGERSYLNVDYLAVQNLDNASRGWITQGIQTMLRPGNSVFMSYQMCGASGRLQMLDGIRLVRR